MSTIDLGEEGALRRDRDDRLAGFRDRFRIPAGPDGEPARYFAGNSLGLQPRAARDYVEQELESWAQLGVRGHHEGPTPWLRYHEVFRGPLARLVGAHEDEVVLMNGLTVNLHLLMVSFFRPTRERYRILIESPVFPSDLYAAQSQLTHHGLEPDALIQVGPPQGEHLFRHEDFERAIADAGNSLAMVLLSGTSYLTGQVLDMPRLAEAAHRVGAYVGYDLAHAAGNVPLALHDWNVDFAAWCSYKYLNGGPGALAGAFVHRRHAARTDLPRFGGWWGNDPDTRFRMHLEDRFVPVPSADGWQLSNPPVLGAAALRASLDAFDEAGMNRLRTKSAALTGYLETLLRERVPDRVEIVTPEDPDRRGCQLSLRLADGARSVQTRLEAHGFVGDFREPDVLRVAPVPLYNTYHDCWALADALADHDG